MKAQLLIAVENFVEFEKYRSDEALVKGLRSLADAIEYSGKEELKARSAVDILTNDEIAQAILDLKASVQAFTRKF